MMIEKYQTEKQNNNKSHQENIVKRRNPVIFIALWIILALSACQPAPQPTAAPTQKPTPSISCAEGALRGYLVDTSGQPIQNYSIAILPETEMYDFSLRWNPVYPEVVTDENGIFCKENLDPGTYKLYFAGVKENGQHPINNYIVFFKDNLDPQNYLFDFYFQTVEIPMQQPVTLVLQKATAQIEGSVTDYFGTPEKFVWMVAIHQSDGLLSTVLSNEDGSFSIPVLDGDWEVVSMSTFLTWRRKDPMIMRNITPGQTVEPVSYPCPQSLYTSNPQWVSEATTVNSTGLPRYFDDSTGVTFSYVPPEGLDAVPLARETIGYVNPDGVSLGFQSMGNADSAQQAANILETEMLKGIDYDLISEGRFDTKTGVDAYKFIYKTTNGEKIIFNTDYFFVENREVIKGTYQRPWDVDQNWDAEIDKVMSTFRFDRFSLETREVCP